MEAKLIAAILQSRDAWEHSKRVVKAEDLSPEGQILLKLGTEFYVTDPTAHHIDKDILRSKIERNLSSNKQAEGVLRALEQAMSLEVSAINVVKEAQDIRRYGIALKLASQLSTGQHTKKIQDGIDEYQTLVAGVEIGDDSGDENEEFTGIQAKALTEKHYTNKNLIQVWPRSLNDQIDGGIRGGHHILVFGPTEGGKTLFVINMCAGFLKQGLKVLYIGNEDPAPDILMRMISRLTGMNKYEVMADPEKADGILAHRNWDKFVFANMSPGTFPKIEELVTKYEPQVVILDQLRNIDVDSDNRTQGLEKAATSARNLAKKYGIPVISVSQAGDSASGRAVLNRGDVDSSNVGIPGQVDLMIGIGATLEQEQRNIRVMSFPKNKLSGRHTPINVTIDPLLSKVIDL